MSQKNSELLKIRDVSFLAINPDPQQAHTAAQLLEGMDGIVHTQPLSDHVMQVRYDITLTTLRAIEDVLSKVGLHLANTLICKLKRALYYYTEDTQRSNLGLDGHVPPKDVKVYVKRYEQLRHGCRDTRPEHWREYL